MPCSVLSRLCDLKPKALCTRPAWRRLCTTPFDTLHSRLQTLAYGVPAVLHADAARVAGADDALEPAVPSVLVLAPTRELALQIEAQIHPLCQALARQLKCLAVVGGEPKDRQIRAVRAGIDILVATPGRLLDLVAAGAATLGQISCVVLDEVDRMLSMNFEPQVRDLLSQVPLLFRPLREGRVAFA